MNFDDEKLKRLEAHLLKIKARLCEPKKIGTFVGRSEKVAAMLNARLLKRGARDVRLKIKIEAQLAAHAARESIKEPISNGVRRPTQKAKSRIVWDAATEYLSKNSAPPSYKKLCEIVKMIGLTEKDVTGAYPRWKKFNNFCGKL